MVMMKKFLALASVSFMAIGCAANASNGVAYQDEATEETNKQVAKATKKTRGLWINGKGGHGERWSDIDTDGDDLISVEEWRARENYEDDDFFDRFDLNEDKKVSRDEIDEYVEKTVKEAMAGVDIKLRKVAELRELKELHKAEMTRVDVERIREKAERMVERSERIREKVTKKVIEELEDGMPGAFAFTFDHDDNMIFIDEMADSKFVEFGPLGKHGWAMAGAGMLHRDMDEDGIVSKEEFLKSAEEEFAKFDTNGDGKIDDQDDHKGKWSYKFKRKEKSKDKEGDK